MDGDHLLQCTGLDEYPADDIVREDRRQMGLSSNPREGMDACVCIVPLWHGVTLNSRRAASPLVILVDGEERWDAPDPPPGCSPLKLG
ncbi:hypothetical protein TNCV_621451 [Trichonephila clavipes]|nr:hypothetical protein TNCV_621451 [Trichonephila clavipes]